MLPTFKEVVEDLFEAGLVRAVFATETLALGINMPARTVVIERLDKWNGETHTALTPGQYTQLTGRAGRRGIDVEGHAVVLWQPDVDPTAVAGLAGTRTYPLNSSFRPSYNMAVNLVRQAGMERATAILESSFAQFQVDRSVAGIARQAQRARREVGQQAPSCDRGDIAEYYRLRRELSQQHGRAFPGISADAMQVLVNAHWPGNVRQLRNLIESMVVLSHGREIRPSDIPLDVREAGTRLLPMRLPHPQPDVHGHELEFIFRSLVELKLQLEELRRRIEEAPQRVQVIDVTRPREYADVVSGTAVDETGSGQREAGSAVVEDLAVVYKPGMKMSEVERAAIEAALKETRGNRRRAADRLGIGERTLYRKIKEYGLA